MTSKKTDNQTQNQDQSEPTLTIQAENEGGELVMDPNVKVGNYVTLQFNVDPETNSLDVRIVKVPLDLRIIEDFQAQVGEVMAQNNLKLVIYEKNAYLVPIKTSSLIFPGNPGTI